MIDFIKHLYKEYRKQQRVKIATDNFMNMISEMKGMKGKEVREKWGNPVRHFTLLKWEIHKAKHNMKDCKIHGYHYENEVCKGAKQTSTDKSSGSIAKK